MEFNPDIITELEICKMELTELPKPVQRRMSVNNHSSYVQDLYDIPQMVEYARINAERSKWIKCCDKLPEYDIAVLAFTVDGEKLIASLNINYSFTDDKGLNPLKWIDNAGFDADVTHWQPLPANP